MTVRFNGQGDTVNYTPSGSDVVAGQVIVVEEKVFVSKDDILDGRLGVLSTNGEFEWPKDNATEILRGKKVYWDEADQELTEDPDGGTNKYVGYVTATGETADETVLAYLVNNVA